MNCTKGATRPSYVILCYLGFGTKLVYLYDLNILVMIMYKIKKGVCGKKKNNNNKQQ